MADKTQINLERIRACDAEWEESKHPRSENGQFTSGGGATVSKLQKGGKAKTNSIKAGEIAKNQERYDNAHKSMAANYLSDLTNAIKGGDYETAREKLERHEKDKKRYDQLTAQNNKFKAANKTLEKARPAIQQMRESAKAVKPAKADANKAAKTKIFEEAAAASKKTAAAKAKKERAQAARTLKKADSEIAKAKAAGDIKSQMFWEAAKNRASKK